MHKTRQLVVDFESESWGICARLRERDAFAVPIRVSRVKADSEAHAKGVQEGDCIVKLEYDDTVEYVRHDGRHPKLLAGGSCRVTLARVLRDACRSCGASDMQVIERDAIVVCTHCGIVHRSSPYQFVLVEGPKSPTCAGGSSGPAAGSKRPVDGDDARAGCSKRAKLGAADVPDPYMAELRGLISELGEKLEVTQQVRQEALGIAARMPRNKSRLVVYVSAALFLACKELGQSRTMREVCQATGAAFYKVSRCAMKRNQGTRPQAYDQLLDRFLGRLDLPQSYAADAVRLQSGSHIQGAPATVAAELIYKVWAGRAGGKADLRKVAEACGVGASYLQGRIRICKVVKEGVGA
ncbi:hypothetical protein GUITHDRAFT_106378 [Guillardia theta CCMP2712]|uniref:Cyclin-like domain-containing protein n=1 Tax=Guillardia theta (strain CCMP2712) TaxID=905079 RepID=L1JIC1_GUITC|nr:hypothetical protein GUITHDRAFT_106378 [Guillardia theta CCMP2712]EKX47830.1 hypothetical protein GUITHDRAFT_106378 [Guillardia theta CCMP2712]|eukprot:XP_005834810.1 hypothetical protein GUITHDRAFT_106378 [Guillardia theta CCMP2712]